MSVLTYIAYYFIFWWIVLFTMLPIGLRTQDDGEDRALGTVASAPRGPHMRRAFLRTTIVSGVIFAIWATLVNIFDISFSDFAALFPDFTK